MSELQARSVRGKSHSGEHDYFEMVHAGAGAGLSTLLQGYTDYTERTHTFRARRELPSLKPVLIINLGAPISVTGADGATLKLAQGEGFLAGLHDRHAVSESQGGQSGVHVRRPWTGSPG